MAIKKAFKTTECRTLIRPIIDETKLAHIEDIPYEQLKPEFRSEVEKLLKEMKDKCVPKIVAGKPLNASMFLNLALEYVNAMNDDEIPTVLTAFERVVESEARVIADKLYEDFTKTISNADDFSQFESEEVTKLVQQTLNKLYH